MTLPLRLILTIIALLLGAILAWLIALALAPMAEGRFPRSGHLAFGVMTTSFSLLLVVTARRVGEKPLHRIQPNASAARSFAVGILCFTIPFMAALIGCVATGLLTLRSDASAPTLAMAAAAALALVLLAEALPEEMIFRGAMLTLLRDAMPAWMAIISQAILFMLFGWMIGAIEGMLDAGFLFSFGLVLGILKIACHLTAAIGFHLAFMTMQQFLGPAWDLVEVSNPDLLQTVVCAIIPFSATIIFLHARVK